MTSTTVKTAQKKRVEWVGENEHLQIAKPGGSDSAAVFSRSSDRPRGMGTLFELRFRS